MTTSPNTALEGIFSMSYPLLRDSHDLLLTTLAQT